MIADSYSTVRSEKCFPGLNMMTERREEILSRNAGKITATANQDFFFVIRILAGSDVLRFSCAVVCAVAPQLHPQLHRIILITE